MVASPYVPIALDELAGSEETKASVDPAAEDASTCVVGATVDRCNTASVPTDEDGMCVTTPDEGEAPLIVDAKRSVVDSGDTK